MNVTLWNGKTVPRIGIGTWVMGGAQFWGDQPTGWAGVEDATSLETLQTAFDLGVRIIDTASSYGGGHAERIVGRALRDAGEDRDAFVVMTKVGIVCDPVTGNVTGTTDKQADIAAAIDASLVRLNLDHIDLVKFHINGHPVGQSDGVFRAFENARTAGKIGGFGWSTDDVASAAAFADLPGFVAIQHDLNLFRPAPDMIAMIEARGMWSFNRQPLAMGLLTGKHTGQAPPIPKGDIRSSGVDWLKWFGPDGRPNPELARRLETVRAALTRDGRTLAQAALAWVLAQSDRTIPLPGCRTPAQARDNFGVLSQAPLSPETLAEVAATLSDL